MCKGRYKVLVDGPEGVQELVIDDKDGFKLIGNAFYEDDDPWDGFSSESAAQETIDMWVAGNKEYDNSHFYIIKRVKGNVRKN